MEQQEKTQNNSFRIKVVLVGVVAVFAFVWFFGYSEYGPTRGEFWNMEEELGKNDSCRMSWEEDDFVEFRSDYSGFSLEFSSSSWVDVYVFEGKQDLEYQNYQDGNYFNPFRGWENVKRVDEEWHCDQQVLYVIVVDNEDNARTMDAEPRGQVKFEMECGYFKASREYCFGGVTAPGVLMAGLVSLGKKRH